MWWLSLTNIQNTFISAEKRVIISGFHCESSDSNAYELISVLEDHNSNHVLCESSKYFITRNLNINFNKFVLKENCMLYGLVTELIDKMFALKIIV